MKETTPKMDVYLEIGQRRTFAGALHWPGWCRSGRDEAAALQALADYGPRYARVLRLAGLEFELPADLAALAVVERLEGDASTDFGAPGQAPASDARPVDDDELARFRALLQACWQAFDQAVSAAAGKALRKGPRGGGRDLEGLVEHVLGSDRAYLGRIGWKLEKDQGREAVRQEIMDGLAASARGELPAQGPRGGRRWTPRYFVRRVACHVLDHAWEIEDRQHFYEFDYSL
jgi:hypothetical protein